IDMMSYIPQPYLVPFWLSHFCYLMILCPLTSPLFPYTTLFRSREQARPDLPPWAGEHGFSLPRYRQHRLFFDDSGRLGGAGRQGDRKSTRLNSSHQIISYAVFCLKKKKHIL